MSGRISPLRLRGLLRKEFLQIHRDPSSILLALVLPLVLLVLFGYGVSLNPLQVPVAVVLEDDGALARDLAARFELSPYFSASRVPSQTHAEQLLNTGAVDGFIRVQSIFSKKLQQGNLKVQLVVNGMAANRARLIEGYVLGAVNTWQEIRRARGEPVVNAGVRVLAQTRFNRDNESRNFLVPGLIAMIMALTGTLLTALVIAREWERGTMETLLASPIRLGELLIAKLIPYFLLGMTGMLLAVAGGIWFFAVPLRGSLWLLVLLSALFLLVTLGFGLAVSAAVKVQFVAAQIAIIAGFLPAVFLSGLIFDLESTPTVIQLASHIIPARYFVAISHTLFLAGDIYAELWPDGLILAGMALLMLLVARRKLSKQLE